MIAVRVAPGLVGVALLLHLHVAAAQLPPAETIARERREYAAWLARDPMSPVAAIANQPIGASLTLGPADSDIPLPGVAEQRIVMAGGRVTITGAAGSHVITRAQPYRLDRYLVTLAGVASRPVVVVYGPARPTAPPVWFPYDGAARLEVALLPAERPASLTVTGADGVETMATEAGTVALPTGERLVVRRIETGQDEHEFEVYVRDATSGAGSYPAGRFVTLQPLGGNRFALDFNRARNPFCAYNTVFPCPAPWPGNMVARALRAGERYGT